MNEERIGRRAGGWKTRLLMGLFSALWAALCLAAQPALAETTPPPPAPGPADTCHGTDLLAGLSPAQRAALIDGAPYPSGNLWRATKNGREVTLVGTYHLDDPRFAPMVAHLAPILARAKALLVEAGPTQQQKLKTAILKDPGAMFITKGQTLPERLPEAEWQALSKAMSARGIPPLFAAKFQPWYVSMLLAIPPCAMGRMEAAGKGKGGLDTRLIAQAEADHVPIEPLEPWDTSLRLFGAMAEGDQNAMIRAALAMDDTSGDMFVTMANAYFRGQHQLVWAFSRAQALATPGVDATFLRHEFAQMQTLLLTARNRAWVPVIEAAAKPGAPVVAAFGAAHLGGQKGVLELLHRAGWTLTRLDG